MLFWPHVAYDVETKLPIGDSTMTLRRLASAAVLLLLVSMILSAQSPKEAIQPRFQLGSGQNTSTELGEGDSTIPAVFLLNNASGQVWKYQEVRTVKCADGKTKLQADMFFPVELAESSKK